jgi:hypothetical protein
MHRSRPLPFSRMSRVTRCLAQIGYWIALAAIPLLTLGSVQRIVAQTTIQVTTTQQGVTDPSNCSLQEAIYAAEFGSNTALNLTDPDRFYTTGCLLQGASGHSRSSCKRRCTPLTLSGIAMRITHSG